MVPKASGSTANQSAKPKKHNHPSYAQMIKKAITFQKERNGSSRQAIRKYITDNFDVGHGEHDTVGLFVNILCIY